MIRYNTLDSFENWDPNIQSLADRLLIGPQRELLQKVQDINDRHGLSLNVTRTYRWSPGYMDKIKDYMVKRYIQVDMKRKISTFFNQIDQKQWTYNSLKRQLNTIDDIMANKRRIRAVFQDNSDLISDRWAIFHEIVARETKKVQDTIDHIDFNCDIIENNGSNEAISFTWAFPEMDMNIFVGNNYFPIEMGKVEVNVRFTIDEIVMTLCNDGACQFGDNTDGEPIITMNNLANVSTYNRFAGWYEPKYINGQVPLSHPFISSYRAETRVIDGNGFTSTCLGDLTGRAWSDMCSMNLLGVTLTLLQWLTTFNARDTRPLNNIRQSYWGLPERVNHPDFLAVYATAAHECNYPDHPYEEQGNDYCKSINCALKDSCDFYQGIENPEDITECSEELSGVNAAIEEAMEGRWDRDTNTMDDDLNVGPDDEIEDIIPLPESPDNNIHGGELHHENPNDNGLGGNMTEEQMLEQLIRQQHRVIDIGRE